MAPGPCLLVANPTAQSGRSAQRIEAARSLILRRGVSLEFLATQPEGKTIQAVARTLNSGKHSTVIAMGGDGTFREVAAGLFQCRRREEVRLALLPTGTANDQGKSFGLSSDDAALARNVDVLLDGTEVRLDACLLKGLDSRGALVASGLFFDSAGWGISARVLARRNRDRAQVEKIAGLRDLYRDELVYAGALIKTFFESYAVSDKFNAEIVADGHGRHVEGLSDLIVKNTRVYAGAWVFDRTSRPDDGQVEVVPFRGRRDWLSKALIHHEASPLREGLLNVLGIKHTPHFRAERLQIQFDLPPDHAELTAQIDGDEFPATPRAEVELTPRALRVVVPGE